MKTTETLPVYRFDWRRAAMFFLGHALLFSAAVQFQYGPLLLVPIMALFVGAFGWNFRKSGEILLGEDGFTANWNSHGSSSSDAGDKGKRVFTPWTEVLKTERGMFRRVPTKFLDLHTPSGFLRVHAKTVGAMDRIEQSICERLERDRTRERLLPETLPVELQSEAVPRPSAMRLEVLEKVAFDSAQPVRARVRAAQLAAASGHSELLDELQTVSADEDLVEELEARTAQ